MTTFCKVGGAEKWIQDDIWEDKLQVEGASTSWLLSSDRAPEHKIGTFRRLLWWGTLLRWLSVGWNPSWDSVVSGSSGSQKDQGCPSAAELPGIRLGKPAANSEARSGLSAQGCHKPWIMAWLGDCSLNRGLTSGRTSEISLPPLGGVARENTTGVCRVWRLIVGVSCLR